MTKYEPVSRVIYDPAERQPLHDEEPILAFLEMGLTYTLKQLEIAKMTNKFGSCYDLQIQALTLRNTIDAFRAGWHDKKHEKREIDPQERAHFVYNLIPMQSASDLSKDIAKIIDVFSLWHK